MKKYIGLFVVLVMAFGFLGNAARAATPTLAAEDFGVVSFDTGLGFLRGYTAGFGLTDATFAGSSVKMQLYAGTTLLQTNTSTAKVGTVVTGTQISSPFDVSGTFNYAVDGFWTNVRETEFGQRLAATRVVATVTLAGGQVLTAENNAVTGDPTTIFGGILSAEDFGVVNFDTGLGILKGYTAGFGLTNATFAGSSVKMQLFAGTTLLQTNTSTAKVGSVVTGTQISSPFDVSGTFNYVADGFWTNVRETQFGQSLAATRVVATVTLASGQVLTAENNTLTGDPTTIFGPILTTVKVDPAMATLRVRKDDDNRGPGNANDKKDEKKNDKDDKDRREDRINGTVQLTATNFDQNGIMFVGAVTTFASSDPAVATVSATGLVTAVKKGTATITATSVSGTATVTGTSVITVVKDDDDVAVLKVAPFVFDPAVGDCVGIMAAFDSGTGNPAPSLHLTKPCATATNAASGATLSGFSGPLTSLAFDFKSDGHCGAGAPRFNVQTNVAFHFLGGCANGTKTDLGNGWMHVTIDPANAGQAFPVVAPTEVVQSIDIIFDEGNDALGQGTPGSVFMDNISVNGLVNGGPVKDDKDDDKNKGKNDDKGKDNSGKGNTKSSSGKK